MGVKFQVGQKFRIYRTQGLTSFQTTPVPTYLLEDTASFQIKFVTGYFKLSYNEKREFEERNHATCHFNS